jgi:argininosuccinate lyase
LVPDLIKSLKFNKDKMSEAISPEMMATVQALQQVKNGVNFRDAYGLAKTESSTLTAQESITNRISLGGASNLGIDIIVNRTERAD